MLRGKVYAILIIGIALFMFGGVSPVLGELLITKLEFIEIIEPEFMEVSEFEFMEVTDPEFMEVTEPEFAGVTGVELFVTTAPRPGVTVWGGELKSVEYLMCAPLNGLPTPKECWYKGQ